MKKRKLKILLLCIPLYIAQIIGEWYFVKSTVIGRKFNFKKETKDYWRDVFYYLKEK